jgi:formylglycine-generating enzyme required for sulfatase activity
LLSARRLGDHELEVYIAHFLGYEHNPPQPPRIEPAVATPEAVPETTPPEPAQLQVARNFPFWQATQFDVLPSIESEPPETDEKTISAEKTRFKPAERKPVDLSFLPLTSDASLLTRLRVASSALAISGEIDVERIVAEWGRGRFLTTIPRSSRKVWGRHAQVFVDRSRRLIPYWEDQARACRALRAIYPPEGYSEVVMPEGRFQPSWMTIGRQVVDYQPPPPGSTVVALSDLGVLDRRGPALLERWIERGRWLRDLELEPLALVPYRRAACPRELSRYWTIIPWETSPDADAPALAEAETEALVTQILTLLSFTLRIEPQLIRFVRRPLAAGRGEPAIESRVWQYQDFGDSHCEAAELPRATADALRAGLPRQDPGLRRQIYERVAAAHWEIYDGVWYAELANLGADEEIDDDERRAMRAWFQDQAETLGEKGAGVLEALKAWHGEVSERLLRVPYRDRGELGRALHQIWAIVHRGDPDALLPEGADLRLLPREAERLVELRQWGNRLIVGGPGAGGSPLALIRARQARLRIERVDDFWERRQPPAWAEAWGRDEYGAWVTFRAGEVVQRMRWIPPGTFWMGSPEDEPGRYAHEGPRHEEVIPRGFWMFDTPCTQALWQEVMGKNPSRFRSPDRPVERVSWDDCQEFIRRWNVRFEGLSLTLPTEAQWEYACRAGTETATYAGPMEIKGQNNAPILHEIAWYGGNSGLDFDLADGWTASDWPEKQFEFAQAGTHPVGRKRANPWGLYDMLGNVWEWCADLWTDDYTTTSRAALEGSSAVRVLRGGSWLVYARYVRAACRIRFEPGYRLDSLGFRFCEFGEPSVVSQGGGEAERTRERGAGGGAPGDRDRASGAAQFVNVNSAEPGVTLDTLAPVSVSSDVERIVLQPILRPAWASALGRDRYGLWAEFTIDSPPRPREQKKSKRGARARRSTGDRDSPSPVPTSVPFVPVRQRLRWIPPGRFLMDSPLNEPGRWEGEQEPHEVTFAEGFWMFDTPCTQALWQAVTGDNPSRFRSPDRPVEQVSRNDCQEFVKRINGKLAENAGAGNPLRLTLPTEAEWEYACRAGTETATYAGPMEIKGTNNAPILHEIAWYGGNSGLDFDLKEGEPASGWPEKQFEFAKAGTHPVGRKRANPWGLRDMLGNVWEWCADVWTDPDAAGSRAATEDPASAYRVVRGGSWTSDARYVRAAYRLYYVPSNRVYNLGVRFCEFRESSVVNPAGSESVER